MTGRGLFEYNTEMLLLFSFGRATSSILGAPRNHKTFRVEDWDFVSVSLNSNGQKIVILSKHTHF
jgi:hypothetical protein